MEGATRPKGGASVRDYESIVIFYPDTDEEERNEIIARLGDIVPQDFDHDYWGDRKFAYEIDKHNHGHYYMLTFKADSESLNEYDRIARIQENIIRFMTINIDDQ